MSGFVTISEAIAHGRRVRIVEPPLHTRRIVGDYLSVQVAVSEAEAAVYGDYAWREVHDVRCFDCTLKPRDGKGHRACFYWRPEDGDTAEAMANAWRFVQALEHWHTVQALEQHSRSGYAGYMVPAEVTP